MRFVLDSSAVLALLHGEPGAERVAAALGEAAISAVNAAEALRVSMRNGVAAGDFRRAFARLQLSVIPFGEDDLGALAAVFDRAAHLSLGDCACLALGMQSGAEVLTADRAWTKLDLAVRVTSIR